MLSAHTSGLYRSTSLDSLDWLEHGFGTRRSAWPAAECLATLQQIHSNHVIEVVRPGPAGAGDALITNEPGLVVGVKTADCVPVLLADTRNRAVAAVHAGWRGTADAILLRTLEKMAERFGSRPEDVFAAIGPCIQTCCYEVGPEVAERFRHWIPSLEPGTRQKLDLIEANLRQLGFAGIAPERVDHGAPCTYCRPEQLHSFRRDREQAGRMISAIGIVAPGWI